MPLASQPALRGITTYAGSGNPQFAGDGGPATEAGFYQPTALTLDKSGNVYLATDHRIRRVDAATGIIDTVVGTGRNRSTGDDGPAGEASLAEPVGITVDSAGNIFIVESGSTLIRRVDGATGIITTVAGGGIGNPREKIFGDGGPATEALIKFPTDVAVDNDGNLYISTDNRIRRIDAATGIITTFAGIGERDLGGDGGPATSAGLAEPRGIVVDSQGNLYIADMDNHRVRKVDGSTGIITTAAGVGKHAERNARSYRNITDIRDVTVKVKAEGAGYSGDDGPATEAMLALPKDIDIDAQGNLFITEGSVRVRKINTATGVITTFVSDQARQKYEGGKVQVGTATFGDLVSVAVHQTGEIFLADYKNNVVHKVSARATP